MKPSFLFRCDASHRIGTGHVVRCLTLAKKLRESGAECRFVCRQHPGHLLDLIAESGFEVIALPAESGGDNGVTHTQPRHAAWLGADWKSDAEQTIAALSAQQPDWLVVDHYAIDHRWESQLRPFCGRIMALDDLADRKHDCDVLLDQNLISNFRSRYNGLVSENCALLLGPEYALLQEKYSELHLQTPPRVGQVRRILVYFGGVDQPNLTSLSIEAIRGLCRPDLAVDVVINPRSPHTGSIREAALTHPWITLHEGLPSLAELMVKADLAIGAGGATSWERCCLALPTIVITLAENQVPIAHELHLHGFIELIGDHEHVTKEYLQHKIHEVLTSPTTNEVRSARCRTLVDGRGTDRVTSLMLLEGNSRFVARPATVADETLILDHFNAECVPGRTDDLERNISNREIFYKCLRQPETTQIIVVSTTSSLPVGCVTFCKHERWEVRSAVCSFARHMGASAGIVRAALLAFRKTRRDALQFQPIGSGAAASSDRKESQTVDQGPILTIAVCSDFASWINEQVGTVLLEWLTQGHACVWGHDAESMPAADLCFFLSYGKIVNAAVRARFGLSLVVHASDLPKGRGWSPTSWMVLQGERMMPVTLLEAVDDVDAGDIFGQVWFDVRDTDLVDDWRRKLAQATEHLVLEFVDGFPESRLSRRSQVGEATYFRKRKPKDSQLDTSKSLAEQFGLFQIADNRNYPVWFTHSGMEFVLEIYRRDSLKMKGHES